MRRFVRITRGRLTAVSVALAALAGGTVALYPGSSGADPQSSSIAEASPAGSFQLLRGAATVTPTAAVAGAVGHAPSSFGLILADARRAAGTGAWLVPGSGELCLVVPDSEGVGMSCASASAAATGGLALIQRATNGGPSTIVGAAPDGVTQITAHTADGNRVATAQVRDNTYATGGQGITGATPSP